MRQTILQDSSYKHWNESPSCTGTGKTVISKSLVQTLDRGPEKEGCRPSSAANGYLATIKRLGVTLVMRDANTREAECEILKVLLVDKRHRDSMGTVCKRQPHMGNGMRPNFFWIAPPGCPIAGVISAGSSFWGTPMSESTDRIEAQRDVLGGAVKAVLENGHEVVARLLKREIRDSRGIDRCCRQSGGAWSVNLQKTCQRRTEEGGGCRCGGR